MLPLPRERLLTLAAALVAFCMVVTVLVHGPVPTGNGLRRSKTVGASPVATFAWDPTLGLPLLLADATNLYVYGPDGGLIQQTAKADDAALYTVTDLTRSIRALVDQDGAVALSRTWDAYGNQTASTGDGASPFGYAGGYHDAESSLIYLRARYYDPSTAQFLTRDPLLSLTRNVYGYTDGDPYLTGDPSGLLVLGWCFGATVFVVGGETCVVASSWRPSTWGYTTTAQVGLGMPTVSVVTGPMISNARTIDGLSGQSDVVSVGWDAISSFGVTFSDSGACEDPDVQRVRSASIDIGVGASAPPLSFFGGYEWMHVTHFSQIWKGLRS